MGVDDPPSRLEVFVFLRWGEVVAGPIVLES